MKYDCASLAGQYFASIMIIVGMSVVATVVVLQYHHHDPNGGNMPKWVSLSAASCTSRHVIIPIDRAFQLLSATQMAALLRTPLSPICWRYLCYRLPAVYFKMKKKKKKKKVSDFLGCESRSVSVCRTLQPECFFQRRQRCGRIPFDTLAFLGFLLSVQCFQKNAEPSYL